MSYRTSSASKKSKKVTIIALLVILVVGAGLAYGIKTRNHNSTSASPDGQETSNIGQPPTYRTESEGQKIEVPENVPEESIKNYELIIENEQFKIRKLGSTYTITLYAIINRPDQYDFYKDQLREYKQNALDYLKNNNINPETTNIIYEPDEAKDL